MVICMVITRAKLRRVGLVGSILAVLIHPAIVWSSTPAFDCAQAQGQVEQAICADDALAALDQRLADVYSDAMKTLPPEMQSAQKVVQRGWIKGRDDCWKSSEINACIAADYQTRIVELQILSGQLVAAAEVQYECADDDQPPFSAVWYNDTLPQSVVLTRGGQDQVIAFIDRSGSGARYTAQAVEFWEHQGEVTVTWFGTELKCRVPK